MRRSPSPTPTCRRATPRRPRSRARTPTTSCWRSSRASGRSRSSPTCRPTCAPRSRRRSRRSARAWRRRLSGWSTRTTAERSTDSPSTSRWRSIVRSRRSTRSSSAPALPTVPAAGPNRTSTGAVQFLALDPATRKHLELTRAQGQNPRATLLATLDACATSMGSRMLARWILAPLVDAHEIARAARRGVGAALASTRVARRVREILKGAFDLERIAQKVRFRRATPRDLASLRRTLGRASPAAPGGAAGARAAARAHRRLRRDARRSAMRRSSTSRRRSSATAARSGPRPTRSSPSASTLRTDARTKLSELEARERERTGIKNSQGEVREPLRLCHRGQQGVRGHACRPSTSASRL